MSEEHGDHKNIGLKIKWKQRCDYYCAWRIGGGSSYQEPRMGDVKRKLSWEEEWPLLKRHSLDNLYIGCLPSAHSCQCFSSSNPNQSSLSGSLQVRPFYSAFQGREQRREGRRVNMEDQMGNSQQNSLFFFKKHAQSNDVLLNSFLYHFEMY